MLLSAVLLAALVAHSNSSPLAKPQGTCGIAGCANPTSQWGGNVKWNGQEVALTKGKGVTECKDFGVSKGKNNEGEEMWDEDNVVYPTEAWISLEYNCRWFTVHRCGGFDNNEKQADAHKAEIDTIVNNGQLTGTIGEGGKAKDAKWTWAGQMGWISDAQRKVVNPPNYYEEFPKERLPKSVNCWKVR